jgi:hypothetical protein
MSETTLYVQSEVTGEGPFAHKVMAARKDLAMRNINKNKTYPNIIDGNLGTIPGEILIYFKHDEKNKKQNVSVFSSLNGHYWGRVAHVELNKRLFGFAGICKTKKEITSGGMSPYQNDNLLAWVESGHTTILCNNGDRMIPAGCLVYLVMPATPFDNPERYINTSTAPARNPGKGVNKSKYTMVTKPFDPCDFSLQIDMLASLFTKSKSHEGIHDMDFCELYDNQPGFTSMKKHSDIQHASAALYYGILGITAMMREGLGKKVRSYANSPSNAEDELNAVLYALQQNCGSHIKSKEVTNKFKLARPKAFNGDQLKVFNSDNNKNDELVRGAYLHKDAITNLFGAFGQMAAEKNRWVIGVCTKDSDVGDPLDVNVKIGTRPYSI